MLYYTATRTHNTMNVTQCFIMSSVDTWNSKYVMHCKEWASAYLSWVCVRRACSGWGKGPICAGSYHRWQWHTGADEGEWRDPRPRPPCDPKYSPTTHTHN